MRNDADRVEFERLHIISLDLTETARFLKEYLDRALYNSDGVVADAFTVAIVVTYSKSFTANKNRFRKRDLSPSFLTASLSDQQRQLHRRIVNERHQAFAHSDAGWQNIRVVDVVDDPPLTVSNAKVPLEKREAEPLLEIVRKMQAVVKPRLERLRAAIGPDEIRR